MPAKSVNIVSVSHRVRGGSQGYLVKGSDGYYYIAKFGGNPQGNRTLINEWIAYRVFQKVGVSVPSMRLLRLSQDVIEQANLHFQLGTRRIPVLPGLHLGSRCPADPTRRAILDFLPRKFLRNVINIDDFAKAFAVDKLLAQTDSRQCIFLRKGGNGNSRLGFRVYMIDHGGVFAGNQWRFEEAPLYGRFDRSVYALIDMHSVCRQTLATIREISETELQAYVAGVPTEWFGGGDQDRLKDLIVEVVKRIGRIDSIFWWQLETLTSKANDAQCEYPPARDAGVVQVCPNEIAV